MSVIVTVSCPNASLPKSRQSVQSSRTSPCRSSVLNGVPSPASSDAGTAIEPADSTAPRSVASSVTPSGIASVWRSRIRTRPANSGQNCVRHSTRPGNSVDALRSAPGASSSVAEPRQSEPSGSTRLTWPPVARPNCGVTQDAGSSATSVTRIATPPMRIHGATRRTRIGQVIGIRMLRRPYRASTSLT
ncbi:Uncharacterised protein [Burkholderia pseudomallei]|nr:Uncharacterised protein [Burkholderia pseudomallei]